MDPISVAASLFTILGTAATAGRALEHLISLRHAPDQLAALTNEVADLRVVLSNAHEAVQGRIETSQDCGSLAHIVERASGKIAELNDLICHDLIKNGAAHSLDSKPKVSCTGFLRHNRKIRSLKVEVREIKLSLLVAVGTLIFADVSRLKLKIYDVDVAHVQSIQDHNNSLTDGEPFTNPSLQLPAKIPKSRHLSETSEAASDWTASDVGSRRTSHLMEELAPRRAMPLELFPFNDLVSMHNERKHDNYQIRVEASVLPLHQCDRYCLCQCHHVTNVATPDTFGKVIGRLFIGYIGLPLLSYRKCNRITCRQGRAQTRIRIAYLFPVWFALRMIALTITKASTTFMWKLNFPVVTQSASPMFISTSLGNTEMIQALLGTNAAVLNAIDAIASKSPLHVAVQFRQVDTISFLVQQGADMYLHDCNNKTPLDTYYENYFTTTEEKRMTAVLPLFEKYDVFDHWNLSYIHLVVLGCSPVDLSTCLTISNDEIDVVDSWGRTALMWAAWRGDINSVSVLLDYGANPHAASFDGNSVLIYATYGGSPECLRLILGIGIDINYISHRLLTPTIGGSLLRDNPAITKVRVERGAAIEASRQQKFTPLYVAALNNRIESLVYLLDSGASTDVESWDCSTPLSISISFNNHRIAEELLKRGAKLNSTSAFTTSYLRSAAVFGDERMIRLFVSVRPAIDINLRDSQGCTAEDRMRERLCSMGPQDPRRECLAAAFQLLVNVCSREYEKAQDQRQEVDNVSYDREEIFHDALEK